MKKILLTLACVFGMSTVASALTSSAVLLQHNGNITTYAPEDIAKVMEDAQDGDEVFLNEGKYPGFTISKQIAIKGVGKMTVINGDVNINNSLITLYNVYIAYLNINGNININSAVNRLRLVQSKMVGVNFSAITEDSYIDRCQIIGSTYNYLDISKSYKETITVDGVTKEYEWPYIKGLTITNSVISEAYGSSTITRYTYFVNCTIVAAVSCLGTVVNSIINTTYYTNVLHSTVFVNSYINASSFTLNAESCTATGCFMGEGSLDYTKDNFAELGYIGNDGTIIGPLGGTTPFTLVPTVPRVTESSLKVDPQKKELNVTVTVTPK